jgi:hypothetical protein
MHSLTVKILSCFFVIACHGVSTLPAQELTTAPRTQVVKVQTVAQMVDQYTPARQLFVLGNVGVGERQLQELSDWLRTNGPHWVVLLADDISGERYVSRNGRVYEGVDAVEMQLGNRLSNETDFGRLENATTGEADGTVLVIMLKQRKLAYFASDTQNSRKLGKSEWVGNLDQPAIRALKSGGRILDAVRDTVKNIQVRLDRTIQSEIDSAAQARLNKQREVEAFKASIASLKDLWKEAEQKQSNFLKKYPNATGPLKSLPMDSWIRLAAQLEKDVTDQNVREMQQKEDALAKEVSTYLNAYAEIEGLDEQKKIIEESLNPLNKAASTPLKLEAKSVEQSIQEVYLAAANGNMDVGERIAQVEQSSQQLVQKFQQEVRQLEFQSAVRKWIFRAVQLTLLAVGIVVGFVLWMLHRRRVPIMEQAKRELEAREADVRRESDRLNELFSRNTDILGSREKVEKRGYEGDTKTISLQALDYVDDLFIMSKEMRRVMEEAREQIYPNSLWGRIVNWFSGAKYAQGLSLMSGHPLKFTEAGGLPRILRKKQGGSTSEAPDDEVTMTFEEAFQALQDHGKDAKNALDTIESSLTSADDQLAQLHQELNQSLLLDKDLASDEVGKIDWSLHSYLSDVAPEIRSQIQTANQLAGRDAVTVVREHSPKIQSTLARAKSLLESVTRAKTDLYPKILEWDKQLTANGFRTEWMYQQLQQLVSTADTVLEGLPEGKNEKEWQASVQSFDEFAARVEALAAAGDKLKKTMLVKIERLRGETEKARGIIANKLSIASASVFQEKGLIPERLLSHADQALSLATRSISGGALENAEASLKTGEADIERAELVIERSLAIAEEFPAQAAKHEQAIATKSEQLSSIQRKLQNWEASFHSDALHIPSHIVVPGIENNGNSLRDIIQIAEKYLESSRTGLREAHQNYRQGNLLMAAENLIGSENQLALGMNLHDFVQEFGERLNKQTAVNRKSLEELRSSLDGIGQSLADPLVSQSTIQALQTIGQQTQVLLNADFGNQLPDPFAVAESHAKMKQRIDQIKTKVQADRQAHAEASRAVRGAQLQSEKAMNLVQQSQQDGIPDSQGTTRAVYSIANMQKDLSEIMRAIESPHGNWELIDRKAYELQSEIDRAANTLASELADAQRVYESFQSASQKVFDAENWIGKHGTRVQGSPGVGPLEQARAALQRGQYPQVVERCQEAIRASEKALQKAQRDDEWLETQARARAEERRRRQRDASFPYGGGPVIHWGGFPTIVLGGDSWHKPSSSSSSGSGSWFGGGSSSSGGGFDFGGSAGGGDWGGGGSGDNGSGFSTSDW